MAPSIMFITLLAGLILLITLFAFFYGNKTTRKLILCFLIFLIVLPILFKVIDYTAMRYDAKKSLEKSFDIVLDEWERKPFNSLYECYTSMRPRNIGFFVNQFDRKNKNRSWQLENEVRKQNANGALSESDFNSVCTAKFEYDKESGIIKIYDIYDPKIHRERKVKLISPQRPGGDPVDVVSGHN